MLVDIGQRGLVWNVTGGSSGGDLWHCCKFRWQRF